jgi:hypothetical protein
MNHQRAFIRCYEARQALRTPAHYRGLWDIKLRQRSQNQSVSQVEEGSTAPAFGIGPLIPLAADRQFRFEF